MKSRKSRHLMLLAAAATLGMFSAGNGPAAAWTLEEAAAPYKGQTVHIACEAYAPCIAYQKFIPEFEQDSVAQIG